MRDDMTAGAGTATMEPPTAGATTQADGRAWLGFREAADYLGIGDRAFGGLVARREITVRRIPGTFPQVCRASLDRVAARYTTPAVDDDAGVEAGAAARA